MKYLVQEKFRLTDKNIYLDKDDVFDPKDENYELSSRSMAAALRARWIIKISDAEAASILKRNLIKNQQQDETEPLKPAIGKVKVNGPKAEKRRIDEGVLGAKEFEPDQLADEVTPGVDELVAARDDRRPVEAKHTAADIKKEIKMKIRNKMKIGKKS